MKCIYCSANTTYSTRRANKGQCGSCHHPFAFEPKTDAFQVTDGLFQRCIKDVSGDGSVFFTERQLWYEFNRRLLRKAVSVPPGAVVIAACTTGGVALSVAMLTWLPFVLLALPGTIGGMVMIAQARRAGPKPQYPKIFGSDFRIKYLAKWISVHGSIERMLPPVEQQSAPSSAEKSPDVTSFSFDRAVVTDYAEMAAMLVANNFHFENNCAVLSVDGYPQNIVATVMTMLRRNPQLRVFAVHDASVQGCALPLELREEDWFTAPTVQVIDLGLLPRHVIKTRWVSLSGKSQTLPSPLRSRLTVEESAWLERGNCVELAVLRPAKLMRAIYQGFARANQDVSGQDEGGVVIWTYDGGADIYAADSFG